jgi:hypothetical protein
MTVRVEGPLLLAAPPLPGGMAAWDQWTCGAEAAAQSIVRVRKQARAK